MQISQKVKKSAQKAKIFKKVAIVSPMRKYPQSPDSFFLFSRRRSAVLENVIFFSIFTKVLMACNISYVGNLWTYDVYIIASFNFWCHFEGRFKWST